MEAKKTPLYEEHVKLDGKMADFAGWIMPLWYPTGQTREHHATRTACGLFDICHMGEFTIRGRNTLPFLSWLLTNNIEKMADGQAMYNFMLNEKGGVVDDCIIYRFDQENWMLVVNAGDIPGDLEWVRSNAPEGVQVDDISDKTVKIDLQGPAAPRVMKRFVPEDTLGSLRFFRFIRGVAMDGMEVLVSRTGYTGEVGFELYTDLKNAANLWHLMLEEGKAFGILPCGLGARDTLRTEAGLPLHGHELRPDRPALGHPWEFAMYMEKDFLGKKALEDVRARNAIQYVMPFKMNGRRKAMPGWEVLHDGRVTGQVLSGVISPSLDNSPIGFVEADAALTPGTALGFRQKGREAVLEGEVSESPFLPGTARKKMINFLD